MPLVVDASVALAWALPDESSAYADAVSAVVERDGLRIPDLWAREIANGLAVAYLRKRITSSDEAAFLKALANLRIEVEEASAAVTAIRNGTAAAFCAMAVRPTMPPMSILRRGKDSSSPLSTRRCERQRKKRGSRFSGRSNLHYTETQDSTPKHNFGCASKMAI